MSSEFGESGVETEARQDFGDNWLSGLLIRDEQAKSHEFQGSRAKTRFAFIVTLAPKTD